MVKTTQKFRSTMLVGFLSSIVVMSSCVGQSPEPGEQIDSTTSVIWDTTDVYLQLISSAGSSLDRDAFGVAVARAGAHLEGAPYVGGLLDQSDSEDLVIGLDGFDCVLLVESALAAARTGAIGKRTASGFAQQIETIRYRDGLRDGYASRLHYFTDWISDNQERGIVEDITREIGGERYDHVLNFMSNNRQLYRKIVENDSLHASIVQSEMMLRKKHFYFIPQNRIAEAYAGIKAGDIIAITTSINGLDISHTGIAHVKDGAVGFLHASTSSGVTIAPDLSTYVNSNARQTGIMVARPLIPVSE